MPKELVKTFHADTNVEHELGVNDYIFKNKLTLNTFSATTPATVVPPQNK